MSDELSQLLAVPTAVAVRGRIVQLSPIRFGELPKTIELAAPLLGKFEKGADLLPLITRHAAQLLPLTAHLSRLPEEEVAELELDEAIELLGSCIAVNADFFTRAITPALRSAAKTIAGLSSSSAPSPASPPSPSAPGLAPQQS